jgi:excisionase family DNA binding protein
MNTPYSYSIRQVSESTGLGRTSLYEEIKTGRLRAVKNGNRTLVLAEDLRSWLASLPPIKRRSNA